MAEGGPSAPVSEVRLRDDLLILLTFTSGIVDVVSFLGLGQIFTANMTGNTVFLAIAVGARNLPSGARSLDALVLFSSGAIVAGRIIGGVKPKVLWPRTVTWVFTMELIFFVAFNIGWVVVVGQPSGTSLYILIGLSSIAMGLQSAGARHLAAPGLTTTVITTALTGLMAEFAALGISGPSLRRWVLSLVALFSGAAVGGAIFVTDPVLPPFLTTATVAIVCAVAFWKFRPGAMAGTPTSG
ncbi:MAG: YoaK family protein [Thermoplasmata archaeon]